MSSAKPAPFTDESGFVPVARASDLRGDGPHAVSAGGVDVVVIRTGGGLRAFQGRCPHQGALLAEGELDGGALVCRNHRWRFDVSTGAREGGPQCLVACPVIESDGAVLVDVDGLRNSRAVVDSGTAGRRVADLPGPRALPLLGNLLQLEPSTLHQKLEGWAAEHGPMYRLRLARRPVVVVSSAELVHEVLRERPETFRRIGKVETVFDELGLSSVFSAEGADWRPQRKLAMEALSHRRLRDLYPTVRAVAARLLRRWERMAAANEVVDVVEELKRFTVDVTTALTFGYDLDTIDHAGDDVIQRHLELVFPALHRRILAAIPIWRLVRLPADRRLERALGEVRQWLAGLVADARARMAADPARVPGNFLESMIAARDEAGEPFSEAVIFGNLIAMLLAGEDTTAFTLAWAVHRMCDSPASVAALRADARAVLGSEAIAPDVDAANRLTYAGAVASEAMRLHPVAPTLFNETVVDTTLGGVELPAGTAVVVLTRPAATAPDRFHHSADFLPDRWLDGGAAGNHDAAASVPFGSGPRICPGRSLALLEMKLVLSMLYDRFDVERVGNAADVREVLAFTMSPSDLRVRLRVRETAG